MNRRCAAAFVAFVFSMGLLASACGGGSSSPTAPSNLPAGFSQTQTGTAGIGQFFRHEILVGRTRTMSLRLTWQDPTVDVDLYLFDFDCVVVSAACNLLATSNSSSGTSETINRTVTNGDRFQAYVENLSNTKAQTYTLTININ